MLLLFTIVLLCYVIIIITITVTVIIIVSNTDTATNIVTDINVVTDTINYCWHYVYYHYLLYNINSEDESF